VRACQLLEYLKLPVRYDAPAEELSSFIGLTVSYYYGSVINVNMSTISGNVFLLYRIQLKSC